MIVTMTAQELDDSEMKAQNSGNKSASGSMVVKKTNAATMWAIHNTDSAQKQ